MSEGQQNDSVLYICMYIEYEYIYVLFQILFHCRLLQDTEYSSLCYAVGPVVYVLYVVVCIC